MGTWKHRLSEVDTIKRTADCSSCGPVKIKKARGRFFRCGIAINEAKRSARYIKKYGVDISDVVRGNCEICGGNTKIAYDHDHKTGKFRGWLCMKCNTALGLVNDDVIILKKLIDYLER